MNSVTAITIRTPGGETKRFVGRDAWALHELIRAGMIGVTPIERPAPRWSHYIYKLRRAGLPVQTITESHGGAYAGTHARYVLSMPVEVIDIDGERRAA